MTNLLSSGRCFLCKQIIDLYYTDNQGGSFPFFLLLAYISCSEAELWFLLVHITVLYLSLGCASGLSRLESEWHRQVLAWSPMDTCSLSCNILATPARHLCTFLVVVASNYRLLSKHLTIFRRYFAICLLVAKLLIKYTAHSVFLHRFFKVGASCSCP